MRLIDTHAHLNLPHFEGDVDAVVRRARDAGVEAIICVGTDVTSSRRAVELSEFHPDLIRAAAGIHPTASADADPDDVAELKELLEHPNVVAVGETGLDYHHDNATPEEQKAMFRRQLQMSRRTDKPVIIHSRSAEEDTLRILREADEPIQGVRHCFDGSLQMAEEFVELGLSISFTALITRGGHKKLKAAAAHLPEDCIMVETDCPFMTPAGADANRNEPALLRRTVETIAELREMEPDELAELTTRNARELFGSL